MHALRSLSETINMIDEISRRLNPDLEPTIPSKEEKALHISTCWPLNYPSTLKEKLADVEP